MSCFKSANLEISGMAKYFVIVIFQQKYNLWAKYEQKLRTWAESGSKVGDGDDSDGGGGRIFPGHPGPIPNAPRDNISRKGIPSLR